jgi:acetolactate synthase I/II/III large subunit
MPTGAEVIAKRLHQAGCRFAFGMPGGEIMAVMGALDAEGVRFVLTKHENAAGFMGEGAWHAMSNAGSGPPAILVATVGPGLANCVNVVANAHQDRVPMIVLSGRIDPAEAETYTHQVFDHQALMRPITKATLCASRGAVDAVIAKAIAIAMSGQPGPVHVDVPITVAEGEEPLAANLAGIPILAPAAPADGPQFKAARALLAAAKRPIVIAGVDAVNQGAGKAVETFCRRFGAPLITSYKGKGLISESDPLALGGAGLSPKADKTLLPLLAQSDCIILAGYDPIEMRIGWRDPWPEPAKVIEFTAVAPQHFMHKTAATFIGDVSAGLAALGEGLPGRNGWPDDAPAQAKAALSSAFEPEALWGPGVVFETIRRLAPSETIITADSGAHRILLSQQWRCFSPRGMLQSSALCTMGCALPLAMGHRLADPDKPAIAFMGDAGLEMVIGELATARDLNLPVIAVVLQDAALALIDLKQRASGRKQVGVTFGATDFAAVAQAFGGYGATVDDRAALETEIEKALARQDRFSLIAARISDRAYQGRL